NGFNRGLNMQESHERIGFALSKLRPIQPPRAPHRHNYRHKNQFANAKAKYRTLRLTACDSIALAGILYLVVNILSMFFHVFNAAFDMLSLVKVTAACQHCGKRY